ncbi:MAG: DUF6580 family putative transport protein [Patescibacteria group bacterium]
MIYIIIILAVISRFIPHMPNFAPITALAIFAAAYLPWKKAFGITFAVRFISDIFLGFVSWPMMLVIYASHLVGILFGLWIKRDSSVIPTEPESNEGERRNPLSDAGLQVKRSLDSPSDAFRVARDDSKRRWLKIIWSSLTASAIFFFATNFAFLYSNYPHNFSGIAQAYINGLPFLRGTLMGDLFYTVALFGGYEFVQYIFRVLRLRSGQASSRTNKILASR